MTPPHPPQVVLDLIERVARHPEPPTMRDAAAFAQLTRLLARAAEDLMEIPASFVTIASSPNRFNDVSWYDWVLVRVDGDVYECDAYTDSRADHHRRLAKARPAVRAASAVLDALEAARWRDVFVRALGLPFDDEFLAVVVLHGLPWLVYASSNCGAREHVFSLWEGAEPRYFGECVERTDEELIDGRGLVFAVRATEDAGP